MRLMGLNNLLVWTGPLIQQFDGKTIHSKNTMDFCGGGEGWKYHFDRKLDKSIQPEWRISTAAQIKLCWRRDECRENPRQNCRTWQNEWNSGRIFLSYVLNCHWLPVVGIINYFWVLLGSLYTSNVSINIHFLEIAIACNILLYLFCFKDFRLLLLWRKGTVLMLSSEAKGCACPGD